MIKLKKLHKSYGVGDNTLHVLNGLDMEINEGELVSIMGSSGSGKSSLLNVLGLLDGFDSGDYHLAGTHIKNLSESKAAYFRNKYLGFVFQSFNLLPFKNAIENVALPLYYQKVNRKQRNKTAEALLEKLGLGDRAHHSPSELSGGQKQRIGIARALYHDADVLVLDCLLYTSPSPRDRG